MERAFSRGTQPPQSDLKDRKYPTLFSLYSPVVFQWLLLIKAFGNWKEKENINADNNIKCPRKEHWIIKRSIKYRSRSPNGNGHQCNLSWLIQKLLLDMAVKASLELMQLIKGEVTNREAWYRSLEGWYMLCRVKTFGNISIFALKAEHTLCEFVDLGEMMGK